MTAIWTWLAGLIKRPRAAKQNGTQEAKSLVDTDAVLAILHPQFHGNNQVGVEIGRDNSATIHADRKLISEYRDWLKTQPPHVVESYEYWLTHYERGCNEAEAALADNARKKFLDSWERDVSMKLREAEVRAKAYPKPERLD